MQGGTRTNLGRTIKDCVKLFEASQELNRLSLDISSLSKQLELAKANEAFIEQLEKAKRELHNADQMRKLTKYSQIKEEIDSLKARLQEDSGNHQKNEERLKSLEKEKSLLQKKVDQVENLREKNLRDNMARQKKWEKELDNATKKYEARQKHFNEIDMDLKAKEDYLNGCQKDIDDAIAAVHDCEKKLAAAQEEVRAFREHFAKFEEAYNDAVSESNEWHAEAKHVQDQIKKLGTHKENCELNKMKRNNQRKAFKSQVECE